MLRKPFGVMRRIRPPGSSNPDGPGALTNFLSSCTVASPFPEAVAESEAARFCCANVPTGITKNIRAARTARLTPDPPVNAAELYGKSADGTATLTGDTDANAAQFPSCQRAGKR